MIKMIDINKIRHHIMVENKTLFYSIMIKRLKKNASNRPLLKKVNIETYIDNLLIKRNPFYAKANLAIISKKTTKNEMKNKILLAIKTYLMEHKNASSS